MPPTSLASFEGSNLLACLVAATDEVLDDLPFGVIGFDGTGSVTRYNAREARCSRMSRDEVIGRPLFTDIAQCMNNYLVAQRLDDARCANEALDETIDFVLTWRMKPTFVRLRMLHSPGHPTRYIVLQRSAREGDAA